jgi:cardiolipin synthase
MNWLLIYEVIYIVVLVLVCLWIVYETSTSIKALAYLLLVIFLPVAGIIFYFSFGINYRKRKMYSKKLIQDDQLAKKLDEEILQYSRHNFEEGGSAVQSYKELAYMLAKNSKSALTANNSVKLLVNGENKFPEVLRALKEAKTHIHIEYYIYEDGEIGRAIEQVLVEKAKAGVTVRFIYDDFGSRSIRRKLVHRLRAAGVKVFPFYKLIFLALANRVNYRNHRKIIVVDGRVAFVGGINVSDRYVNKPGTEKKLFWRDTHLRIEGPGVLYLQYLFLSDWNFCARDNVELNELYFPRPSSFPVKGNKIVQIAGSGPDSDTPTVLFALLQAINLATKEILLCTPYFIPGESILDALIVASLGGVSVKLLVPGISDSAIVNAAARSYYGDLLNAGVEIYLYRKGFIHAKTMVADRKMAIVGTANMDTRSFDLNFEVNAIVYDEELAGELTDVFYEDIKDGEKIDAEKWKIRPWHKQLVEKIARLVSPLL